MLTTADMIARAAAQPLKDAAFMLWSQRDFLNRLEADQPDDTHHPRLADMLAGDAILNAPAVHAEFDRLTIRRRLKAAHPQATDAERDQAIAAAIKFNDDCFKHFMWDGDFSRAVERAVRRAAGENSGYQSATLQAAENHVAYYMK
jgi:hypothetical protein